VHRKQLSGRKPTPAVGDQTFLVPPT
jgi:hypothetical protein